MSTVSQTFSTVKPEAFIVRTFNSKGQWFITQVCQGGEKATQPISAADVPSIEGQLKAAGWRVNPSLSHSGFNARLGGAL